MDRARITSNDMKSYIPGILHLLSKRFSRSHPKSPASHVFPSNPSSTHLHQTLPTYISIKPYQHTSPSNPFPATISTNSPRQMFRSSWMFGSGRCDVDGVVVPLHGSIGPRGGFRRESKARYNGGRQPGIHPAQLGRAGENETRPVPFVERVCTG